jgi:hypothetical protein
MDVMNCTANALEQIGGTGLKGLVFQTFALNNRHLLLSLITLD